MMLTNAKEEYQKKTETRLKKIRTRISTLEKRAGSAEADIEVRYDQKMDQVRGQYDQVKSKLEEMGKASDDDWVDLTTELDRAIDILSEAVDSIAHQISA